LGARWWARDLGSLTNRGGIDLPQEAPGSRATGGHAPDLFERFGLTPRERDVLLRVAEGRTNRQIAAELYISDKTASVHVSRILSKLAVANRAEATAVAHRLGLVEPERGGPEVVHRSE
jgi:DNA-binding NarL/FixJ family response regulator